MSTITKRHLETLIRTPLQLALLAALEEHPCYDEDDPGCDECHHLAFCQAFESALKLAGLARQFVGVPGFHPGVPAGEPEFGEPEDREER